MSTLATVETGSFTPSDLFAGDSEVITNTYNFAASVVLAINSVVAFNTSGNLVEWVPGAGDSTAVAVGITCEAVDTTGGAATNPIYVGGYFNTDAIAWPTGTTAAQKKAAFINSNITHRSLGYSG